MRRLLPKPRTSRILLPLTAALLLLTLLYSFRSSHPPWDGTTTYKRPTPLYNSTLSLTSTKCEVVQYGGVYATGIGDFIKSITYAGTVAA
ncbi:hypothetical protein HK097_011224, partial [Rhizophlyctis rosea]